MHGLSRSAASPRPRRLAREILMLPALEAHLFSDETLKGMIFDLSIAARRRHEGARLMALARTLAQHLAARRA
jgi:hypothetical protein